MYSSGMYSWNKSKMHFFERDHIYLHANNKGIYKYYAMLSCGLLVVTVYDMIEIAIKKQDFSSPFFKTSPWYFWKTQKMLLINTQRLFFFPLFIFLPILTRRSQDVQWEIYIDFFIFFSIFHDLFDAYFWCVCVYVKIYAYKLLRLQRIFVEKLK